MMPFALGPLRSAPSTCTPPASGARKPAMMFISVVLPQPDGPTIATNSPSATSKLRSSITSRRPLSAGNPLRTPCSEILVGIAPPHDLHALEHPHDAVQGETDEPDDDHAGDHEVVPVACVARVDDEVTQPRTQRDHLGRHHDQPGDAEAD